MQYTLVQRSAKLGQDLVNDSLRSAVRYCGSCSALSGSSCSLCNLITLLTSLCCPAVVLDTSSMFLVPQPLPASHATLTKARCAELL